MRYHIEQGINEAIEELRYEMFEQGLSHVIVILINHQLLTSGVSQSKQCIKRYKQESSLLLIIRCEQYVTTHAYLLFFFPLPFALVLAFGFDFPDEVFDGLLLLVLSSLLSNSFSYSTNQLLHPITTSR